MDAQTRPPDFDARVMAYMPGLQNLARKYKSTTEERNDLVTDTIVYALEKWDNFNESGGMYSWLAWSMRGIASNQRKRKPQMQVVDAPLLYTNASTPATQEQYCELSSALRAVPPGRSGAVLLRRAMGDELHEIGADFGISRQRVQQIELRARAALAVRVAA